MTEETNVETGGQPEVTTETPSWFDGASEDTSALIGERGWKGIDDLAKSYRNLELHAGGSKKVIELPDSPEAMNDFYAKIGKPEEASAYKVDIEGDDAYKEFLQEAFHKSNMLPDQAKAFTDQLKGRMEAAQEEARIKEEAQIKTQEEELKKEWGQAYEEKLASVEAAKKALEINDEEFEALSKFAGPGWLKSKLAKIAEMSSEGSVPSVENKPRGALTPAEANQKIADMQLDSSTMDALMDEQHPQHKYIKQQYNDLIKLSQG